MLIEFFERNVQTGRRQIVEDVFCDTLSFRPIHELSDVVNSACNQRIENGKSFSLGMCIV